MEIKYFDLDGLKQLITNCKNLFSKKDHTHVASDISGLEDLLKSSSVKPISGVSNFPSVGSSSVIYIDTSDNKTYRWSAEDSKYYCIGSDYSEIKLISCGDASN